MPTDAFDRGDALRAGLILACALAACTLAYLAYAVPGAWFPTASPKASGVSQLTLLRGKGSVVGDELVVSAPDASGIAIVTLTTDFRSTDYAGIAWIVAGLRENADVRLLWRSNVQPEKLNSTPIAVEAGRALPTVVAHDRAWIGKITGLALAIHRTLSQPVRIRGVVAKPMGAPEIIHDRLAEWFAFEGWNGASINTITGGADNQAVRLPAVVALIVVLAAAAVVVVRRFRPGSFRVATPTLVAALFLTGWLILDARWTWNLIRQEQDTATRYGGKDSRDRLLANEDGPLFAFIEKARSVLPQSPTRIFIASDADYFRGRAAYHLYPHRVFFDPRSNALPAASAFRAGDWLLVFQQRGIQFDRTLGKVRWDGQTVNAEARLV